MLEIRLLGQFSLRRDGRNLELASRPAQSLLAYLVLNAETPQRREKLAGMLWPDFEEENARTNLRGALWRIKEAIGEGYVVADRVAVSFQPSQDYWLDTKLVTSAANQHTSIDELIRAAEGYAGELLPGFYDEWITAEREPLQAAFERKMQMLLEKLTEEARWIEVVEWSEHWIARSSLPEPAFRALMTAHCQLGDSSSMVVAYQRLEQALADQLGVDPSPETEALYHSLLSGDVQIRRPSREAAGPTISLPSHTTPFIGRSTDEAALLQLLSHAECRLVTVISPGGMGKTRLAIQVAAAAAKHYRDGVYFVALASLQQADAIIPMIAEMVGVGLIEGMPLRDQLFDHLRGKHLLLVLDNFEHLLSAADKVADLLAAAPKVHVLVTTQERLNLQSECLYELGGLLSTAPEAERLPDAVDMFIAYARRASAGLSLAPDDYAEITRICQMVGGMPLAIELAAAWVPMLSIHEIAQEIEDDLALLSTSARDVPERHRRIRGVVERSWSMLTPDERTMLMRLSILEESFTREAAKAVAEVSLAALTSLVSKALIQHDGVGRYTIHEIVRRYAAEQLYNNPTLADESYARGWHYAANLLQRCETQLRGERVAAALDVIDQEFGSIQRLMAWGLAHQDFAPLSQVVVSLWVYHSLRGLAAQGRALFEEAANALGDAQYADPVLQWKLRAAQFDLTIDARQKDAVSELLAAIHKHNAAAELGIFYPLLLGIAAPYHDPDDTQMALDEALVFAKHSGDLWQHGGALFIAGHSLSHVLGRPIEGRVLLEQAVEVLRRIQATFWLARALITLADSLYQEGAYEQAQELLEEGQQLAGGMQDHATCAWAGVLLGRTAAAQGRYAEAQSLYDAHLAPFRELRVPYMRSVTRFAAGQFAILMGDYAAARKQIRESNTLNTREARHQIQYLTQQGVLALASGQLSEALDALEAALAESIRLKTPIETTTILGLLGRTVHQSGDSERALGYYRESLRRGLAVGLLPEVLRTLVGLVAVFESSQPEYAIELASIVAHHSATHDVERRQANAMLKTLKASVPDDAYQSALRRGKSRHLDEVVDELLAS